MNLSLRFVIQCDKPKGHCLCLLSTRSAETYCACVISDVNADQNGRMIEFLANALDVKKDKER